MSEYLTPKECLEALLRGDSLTCAGGDDISLTSQGIYSKSGVSGCWKISTEPKPKVKRAPYLYAFKNDERPIQTHRYFKDDADFCIEYPKHSTKFYKRLTALEVECDE